MTIKTSFYSILFCTSLFCTTLGLSTALAADQSDPRLDELFDSLLVTEQPRALQQIEAQIWKIWMHHENEEVRALMVAASQSMNQSLFGDALLVFSAINQRFPDYAEAWNKLATVTYLLEDYEASIEAIEATLALEPRHFGALSGLGLIYIERNELSKAKQCFERLLLIHPASPNAIQNLQLVEQSLLRNII